MDTFSNLERKHRERSPRRHEEALGAAGHSLGQDQIKHARMALRERSGSSDG